MKNELRDITFTCVGFILCLFIQATLDFHHEAQFTILSNAQGTTDTSCKEKWKTHIDMHWETFTPFAYTSCKTQ